MFAAIAYADAVGAKDDKVYSRVRTANIIGIIGFVATFASLFIILLLIGFWLALIGGIAAIAVFLYLTIYR